MLINITSREKLGDSRSGKLRAKAIARCGLRSTMLRATLIRAWLQRMFSNSFFQCNRGRTVVECRASKPHITYAAESRRRELENC